MLKTFGKFDQWTGEKFGTYQATELTQAFLDLEKQTDVRDAATTKLLKATEELLQPNPAARAKLRQVVAGKTVERKLPQPEEEMGDVMLRGSAGLKETSFGLALEAVGNAERQVAEARNTFDSDVMYCFIKPLMDFQNITIKDVNSNRKRLESRRLEYDAAHRNYDRKQGSAKLKIEEEFKQSKSRFEESKETTFYDMVALVEKDAEHCQQVQELVRAQLTFHKEAVAILQPLIDQLQARVYEASGRAPRERYLDKKELAETGYMRRYMRAMFDFEAEAPHELSLTAGDRIEILTELDENWLEGCCNGKTGLFPISYVE